MTCGGAGGVGKPLLTCENQQLDISHKAELLQIAYACVKSDVSLWV